CVTSGRLDYVAVVPGNTLLPFVTACVTGVFFLAFLLSLYWVAALVLPVIAALGWTWARRIASREDQGRVDIGLGASAPVHHEATFAPGWCGSLAFLAADATMFASLLFGFAYLWTIAPNWPPPAFIDASVIDLAVGAAGFALAAWAARRGLGRNRKGDSGGAARWSLIAAGGLVAGALALLAAPLFRLPAPSSHAYPAIATMLVVYTVLH